MALKDTVQKRFNYKRQGWDYSLSGLLPATASAEQITAQTCTITSWSFTGGAAAAVVTITPGSGAAMVVNMDVAPAIEDDRNPRRMAGGFTVSCDKTDVGADITWER